MEQNKKTRLLLLSVSSTSFFYEQLVLPFGLVSLGSYVDGPDYEIKGIEMNRPAHKVLQRYLNVDEEVMSRIVDFSPDIVAMSTYSSNMYNVLFWTKTIKQRLPDAFIVIGGNHASYMAQESLEYCSGLDAVIKFEGEIPFKALCEKIASGSRDFSDVPNMVYRDNGRIVENEYITYMRDLDSLPILNRSYFGEQDDSDLSHADVISARGCTANCTFCNCNHYWSKTHRTRSIQSVIKEIETLKKKYPLKSIRFRDETLTLRKKYCIEVCNAIIGAHLNDIKYQAHSRLDGLDEEVIKELSMAGFEQLFIGVESGSKDVLKRLKKGINLSKLETIIPLLREYNIRFRLSFMSSTPKETFQETLETVKLIKKLKLSRDEYYIGVGVDIYPGTFECERFLKIHPDYKWLGKDYDNFKGRYFALKDVAGNILHPKYREYSLAKTAVIFFLLSPEYFMQKLYALCVKKIKSVFKIKS
ncbi:MAG: B12-binding domain-containing radical SAM protein [Proteobacteria bacterium]|nr:B12-binding domain-containing radical SAM protein [Pseudomonadota bacterium]MBU1389491.1 B12-binding domain-containing radical SAM protein [Pseudomonadota bacterium]MBU1541311.1 B12-binding domain-containing radical SAM protein [Pseudomonadota bacterium]MBU2429847.1 B12-binding domain-containing radical SAM protein [Pseudomonadota bacterium]MBU2480841.1 B12-binding domain-containing radical SAM protein [Pseudomonadota bacterium]